MAERVERERERREEEAALKYIAIFSSVLFRGIAREPMMLDTDAMRCDAIRWGTSHRSRIRERVDSRFRFGERLPSDGDTTFRRMIPI